MRPPPGWKPRVAAPPPLPVAARSRGSSSNLTGMVIKAGLIGLMVLVCVGVGWLSVQGGKRRAARLAATVAEVAPAPEPVKVAEEPVKPPAVKTVAKASPAPAEKTPAPKAKAAEPKRPEPPPAAKPKPPEPAPMPSGPVLTYEQHILPILERSCLNCHDAKKKRGGLDLTSLVAAVRGGDNGTSVKAGKPNESTLLQSIVRGEMPPSGKKLPEGDVKMIRDWIVAGAKGR